MTVCYFLNEIEVSHDEFPDFDGLAFDDIDIRVEGIGSQNSQHERRIIIREGLLGPFGIFGKVKEVKRLVLIKSVRTCLGRDLAQTKKHQSKRHTHSSEPAQKKSAAERHAVPVCLGNVHRKFAR